MNQGKYYRASEQVAIGLCIGGLALRLLEMPLADILLMAGLLTLGFLYLLSGIILRNDAWIHWYPVTVETDITPLARIIGLVSGLGMSVASVGILFRLLHWPGWQQQLMVGMVTSAVALIGVFFVVRQQETKLYQYLSYRLVMMLGMGILLTIKSV